MGNARNLWVYKDIPNPKNPRVYKGFLNDKKSGVYKGFPNSKKSRIYKYTVTSHIIPQKTYIHKKVYIVYVIIII